MSKEEIYIKAEDNVSANESNYIEQSLESLSHLPQTETAECTPSTQPRLLCLDGTYFKYLPEESTANQITGLCMKCPDVTKVKGYNNCTSNFLSHLKRKHGNKCIEEYKTYAKKKKTELRKKNYMHLRKKHVNTQSSKTKKLNEMKITQDQFDENILKYFIHSMIPLRAVEDPYFSKIFTDLDISEMGLTLMNRPTLCCRIEKNYEMEVNSIKTQLNQVDYVCTTIDIWSSKKMSFIGVNAHWITHDLQRVSVALACRRFEGVLGYDRLSEVIQEINIDFELNSDKIIASLINNGRNFAKTFQTFGVELSNIDTVGESTIDCDSSEPSSESEDDENNSSNKQVPEYTNLLLLPSHLRCCAHTLSLCATIDANKILSQKNTPLSQMHATILKKCNTLWKAAKRPKNAEIIQDVLQHTLSRPDKIRWNSLFDALQQIYNMKDKSLALHRVLKIKNCINENEFEYLKEYLMCTAPVVEALDILQSESNAYYGMVLPCLLALRKKLVKIETKNNFSFCSSLIKAYKESIEKRFENLFDLSSPDAENAAIAALSYPRFKNKWLNVLEPNDGTEILKLFKTCISKQMNGNAGELSVTSTKTIKENSFFNFDSDSDSEMSPADASSISSISPLGKAELLMQHFFGEESQDLQLLNNYPEIKSIFIKYNTPLPSSAAVERVSFMTNLSNSHKLSKSLFEKRVVLKLNLKQF